MTFRVSTAESRKRRREERVQIEKKRLREWQRWFAIIPMKIATDEDGKVVYAWLQWIEFRSIDGVMEYRLPGSNVSYKDPVSVAPDRDYP